MDCQLQTLPDSGNAITRLEAIAIRTVRIVRYLWFAAAKVLRRPARLIHKYRELAGLAGRNPSGGTPRARDDLPVLDLARGERVRVKDYDAIVATLDEHGSCQGLSYIPAVMNRYCGREFTVRKRVNLFFDEKRWKMLKARDVVLLDGVFCEPSIDVSAEWAGCSRTCFLFWKEAWLERV